MTSKNDAKMSECPKCGPTRGNVVLSYTVRASHRIVKDSAGSLIVKPSPVNETPPGGAFPHLRCQTCGEQWNLHKGTTVVADNAEKTLVFRPAE